MARGEFFVAISCEYGEKLVFLSCHSAGGDSEVDRILLNRSVFLRGAEKTDGDGGHIVFGYAAVCFERLLYQ